MANRKHKKHDRLEILREWGPLLLDCDISDILGLTSGQYVHGGSIDVALSKRAIQRMFEEGRAKITTSYGEIMISAVE